MSELKMSPEAREAAASCYNKIANEVPGSLYALRHNEGVRLTVLRLLEESLQLAINSAVAEKDKEIERLKGKNALDCNHWSRLGQLGMTSKCPHCSKPFNYVVSRGEYDVQERDEIASLWRLVEAKGKENDQLRKQLAELREIAEELSERIKRTVCDSDDESHAALTRYTQWKESQKCTFCNGTGKVDSHNDTCPDCDGKGKQ